MEVGAVVTAVLLPALSAVLVAGALEVEVGVLASAPLLAAFGIPASLGALACCLAAALTAWRRPKAARRFSWAALLAVLGAAVFTLLWTFAGAYLRAHQSVPGPSRPFPASAVDEMYLCAVMLLAAATPLGFQLAKVRRPSEDG